MKRRSYINTGYQAHNGYVFTAYDTERYNRILKCINTFYDSNMIPPGYMFDRSYEVFEMIIKLHKG